MQVSAPRAHPAHRRPLGRRAAAVTVTASLVLTSVATGAAPATSRAGDGRPGAVAVHRRVHAGALEAAGSSEPRRTARRAAAPSSPADARIVTVDARSYTGAENAIHAPDRRTVLVAYKRFMRNPYDPGGDYVPAQLRVARSDDAGRTWRVDVVDASAIESGDTIDQTVSIDGDGHGAVYVAYLVQSGGAPADMTFKVARSTDGGATWTVDTLASDGVGAFNAIEVVDADTVLVAGNESGDADALRLYSTTDGGAHWDSFVVDDFGWYADVARARSGRLWLTYYHPGETDLYAATSAAPQGPWTGGVIAGAGFDNYTGIASSLAVARGDVYVSYETFTGGRDVLRVARSTDGGESWSRTSVDAGGWNTAIAAWTNALGTTESLVAYWHLRRRPSLHGRVRLAHSADGGDTWTVSTIPERGYVDPYLDLAVAGPRARYVAYQVADKDTGDSILRVARLRASD